MRASLLLAALIATSLPMRAHSQPAGVLSYHGSPERSGHFVVPGLTWERARSLHLDQNFHARVVRLAPDLHRSTNKRDFFAPPDWHALDARDADLGGTNPLPLRIETGNGVQDLVLALGKDGRAYVLDHHNLGGIGGSLVAQTVSSAPIRTAPASYAIGGDVYVAFQGSGARCRPPAQHNELTVLKIGIGVPPRLTTVWCAALRGAGSPIVTTTDGHSDPIVWIAGAEGDNRLHGFRGDTGEPVFAGGGSNEVMTGLRHFQTLITAQNRLFVASDGRLYAFAF